MKTPRQPKNSVPPQPPIPPPSASEVAQFLIEREHKAIARTLEQLAFTVGYLKDRTPDNIRVSDINEIHQATAALLYSVTRRDALKELK